MYQVGEYKMEITLDYLEEERKKLWAEVVKQADTVNILLTNLNEFKEQLVEVKTIAEAKVTEDEIDTILKKENVIVNDEVRHFIENYKDMVERNIMKKYDAKTLELCSRIYKEYGDVIDLINKYGAPKISLCNILEEVLEQKDYLKRIYRESDSVILALPSKLSEEQLEKMQIADWKPDNCFVNIKFSILQWKSDKVTVEILFAPLKSDTNKELKEKFKQALINKNKDFKFGNSKDGWEWTDFGTLISLEEYRSYDSSDDVKKHISEKLDSYKEKYIDSLTEIINEFL